MKDLKQSKKLDKICIVFLLTFYLKIISHAVNAHYSTSILEVEEFYSFKYNLNIFLGGVFIFQFYLITEAFYKYKYYQIVASLYYSFFCVFLRTIMTLMQFVHYEKLLIKEFFAVFGYFVALFELIYLYSTYKKFDKNLIWNNYIKIGLSVETRNKIILEEKLKALLKIFLSIVFVFACELVISAEFNNRRNIYIITCVFNTLVYVIYSIAIKYRSKILVLIGLTCSLMTIWTDIYFDLLRTKFYHIVFIIGVALYFPLKFMMTLITIYFSLQLYGEYRVE